MNTSAPGTPQSPQGGADPSMEDILASIRRILSEDETQPGTPPAEPESHEDVLPLDTSMLVDETPPLPKLPPVSAAPPPAMTPPVAPPPTIPAPAAAATPHEAAPMPPRTPPHSLMGDEASAAASSSVGALLRTLATERQQVQVRSGGPTIEDLVREEIRPLLKTWLDTNLPAVVERLVRAEIERVVGRALS